ncbi:MAG TPA: GUN4 domain-containing protein [Stenomitos sp.]
MSQDVLESVFLITSSDPERNTDGVFGTGFVIDQDEQTTYLLTCAHVVEDVGGSDKVKVDGHLATVEAVGNRYGCDLAVLSVRKPLLKLPILRLDVVGEKGRDVTVAGYYRDGTKTCKLAQIGGKLGDKQIINLEGDRTKAWNLQIERGSEHDLKSGYSGSPVIDKETGYVLGVVAQQTDKGKGLAISIEALKKIWSESVSLLLPSEQGVNYTELRDLLAQGKWKEADEETLLVMLKVADLLSTRDIETFPCTDLRTIDTLWVKYSKGRFGFSVQKRIWESVGGTPDARYDADVLKRFGDRVKWRVDNNWLVGLTFTTDEAPEGHLPWGGYRYILRKDGLLFSRVETCRNCNI